MLSLEVGVGWEGGWVGVVGNGRGVFIFFQDSNFLGYHKVEYQVSTFYYFWVQSKRLWLCVVPVMWCLRVILAKV